jgi:hypothetical protein
MLYKGRSGWRHKERTDAIIHNMGGASGEVSGKTKIETYQRYIEQAEKMEGSWDPPPRLKKICKSLMEKDADTGEWILRYHWHS